MKVKALQTMRNYNPCQIEANREEVIEGQVYDATPATNIPYEGAVWISKFSKGQGLFLFKDQYELVGE